jgi:hypothetical protein
VVPDCIEVTAPPTVKDEDSESDSDDSEYDSDDESDDADEMMWVDSDEEE